MIKPRRSRNRAIIAATAAGALLIGGAVVALAAPSAPTLTGGPGVASASQYTNNPAPAFTWTGGAGGLDTFAWAVDGQPALPAAAGTTVTIPAQADGEHVFRVAEAGDVAVDPPEDPLSPAASATFFVDTHAPTFSRSPLTPSAAWITGNVTITYTCTDNSGGSGILPGSCPASPGLLDTPAEDGVYTLATGNGVQDRALNPAAPIAAGTLKRDSTDPAKPALTGPLLITNVLNPTLSWTRVEDVTPSGVNQVSEMKEYVLTVRQGQSGGSVVPGYPVTVGQPVSGAEVSQATVGNLTNGTTYNWTVQAVDNAGNTNTSAMGVFKVDTTAPDNPVFSSGPTNGAATNDSTPSFTFSGVDGATFTWETRNSLDELITGAGFSGTGAQTTVTLPTLADGNYSFKVKQTAPNAKSSGFATALFTVDTTAPAAPNITSSPGTTTNAQPSFGWNAAEQDGTFVWEVTGVGGVRVQGPGETSTAAVSLPVSLNAGNYAFRVRQRDRAGNLSDWSAGEPFTIVNPTDAGNPPTGGGGTTSGFRPSTRNAKALLPKVGTKIKPAAATLKWKRTRGATLYNLQIFRIDGTTYRKVHSAFPRGLKYRVPKKILKPGRRYVWRVWPYLGKKKKYTPAPFGISWFDAK
ncbi:MAG: hypothetical protein IT200_13900 [Thermoleophilia bacterium]|nr:hypothetical protein [Thermoleophilia bacterium]